MTSVVIKDGFFDPALVKAAGLAWPDRDWPHWFTYHSPIEKKQTCNKWDAMPEPCQELLRAMLLLPVGQWLGISETLYPDLSLWGGGMHSMNDGDYLDLHLDADHHPHCRLERRANAVLYLSRPDEAEFELWNVERTRPVLKVPPEFGRLMVFETNDQSFHGLPRPLNLGAVRRKTLTVFWFSEPTGALRRSRARFVGPAGDSDKAHVLARQVRNGG